MYRPPDQDVNEFNKFIDCLLVHVTKKKKKKKSKTCVPNGRL